MTIFSMDRMLYNGQLKDGMTYRTDVIVVAASFVACFALHFLVSSLSASTLKTLPAHSPEKVEAALKFSKTPVNPANVLRWKQGEELQWKIKVVATVHAILSSAVVAYLLLTHPGYAALAHKFLLSPSFWVFGIASLFVAVFTLAVAYKVVPSAATTVGPTVLLALISYLCATTEWPSEATDFVNHSEEVGKYQVLVTVGYFLYDFSLMMAYPQILSIGMLVHHVFSIIIWPVACVRNKCTFYILVFIGYELSTPSLHLRWFMDKLEMKKSPLYVLNGFVLLALFYAVRILSVPSMVNTWRLCWQWLPFDGKETDAFEILFESAMVIPVLLNCFWFTLLWKGFAKALRGVLAPSKSDTKSQ